MPARSAILVIDVQRGILNPGTAVERPAFYRAAVDTAVPNIAALIEAGRRRRVEVCYTVIQSLTQDGRDRGLDYKFTGFHFPPGSEESLVIDSLWPGADDIVFPKTSSSLFNSTVFEYVMRNMGIDTVIATGFLTDQCVDHTIRDGADRGFRMVCAVDACATESIERHDSALRLFSGYCRQATTATLIREIEAA